MLYRGVPFMIKCDGLPNNESKIVKPSLINPNNLGEQPKTSLVNEIVSKFNEIPKLSNLVPKKEKTPIIKKVGPKIDADKKAIEGFLKSVGLTNENQLEKTQNNGNICYVFITNTIK